jgi:putative ABC transport system substrate-binding protein
MTRRRALLFGAVAGSVLCGSPPVRAGILVGFGGTNEDMLRRLPHFVIRILEGTPPAEMPVELPTRFHTALNLKTAKALGLTLPQSLLLQATEVVE